VGGGRADSDVDPPTFHLPHPPPSLDALCRNLAAVVAGKVNSVCRTHMEAPSPCSFVDCWIAHPHPCSLATVAPQERSPTGGADGQVCHGKSCLRPPPPASLSWGCLVSMPPGQRVQLGHVCFSVRNSRCSEQRWRILPSLPPRNASPAPSRLHCCNFLERHCTSPPWKCEGHL